MSATASRLDLRAGICRFCGTPLAHSFVDLGVTPPSNSYLRAADLRRGEAFYPLHAYVCEGCLLVQLEELQSPDELFSDYAYFSSYSETWLNHAERYADGMIARFGFGPGHQVVEVASNDGYLLQYFKARGVPVLGIEPAANVARAAVDKGIATRVSFFGRNTARRLVADGMAADLLIANNVLAHVPDLNDFVAALKIALKADGIATIEFPHLLRLIAERQFDTIYHEHFSYFSLSTAETILGAHGLTLFDVEEVATHGGSLRVFACHAGAERPVALAVERLRHKERAAGLDRLETYAGFNQAARAVKRDLLRFLIAAKEAGKTIVGYGAPAKGNTLLNFCGIGTDFLDYTVDRSPHKQRLFLPGSRIPVLAPERIRETRPDYVLILPWNLTDEIVAANGFIRDWGGRFVVPIPTLEVLA
jgi:SAM-dependent methyltransferase